MRRKGLQWFILLFCVFFRPMPLQAADVVVGTDRSSTCHEAAFDSALNSVQAAGGGTIAWACGASTIIQFTNQKVIYTPITLDGGNAITLSGGNATRLFAVNSGGGSLTLRDIILTNGYSSDGGAIYNNGSLTLDNAIIRNSNTSNSAGSGGAIVSYGPLTITDSRLENNSAANGGALYLRWESADALITNSVFYGNRTSKADNSGLGGAILLWDGADVTAFATTFESNEAGYGGAMANAFANSSASFEQGSLFLSNKANRLGGAISNSNGTLTILDSTLSRNKTEVGSGGGIYSSNSSVRLERVLLHSNLAKTSGGGISSFNDMLALYNVSITNNIADSGGGIYLTDSSSATLRYVTMFGNFHILTNNSALHVTRSAQAQLTNVASWQGGADSPYIACGSSVGGQIISLGHNISSDSSCPFNQVGDRNNTDPLLNVLGNNGGLTPTHMPKPGSPIIDGGACTTLTTDDQRGAARPVGVTCDIGAVEAGGNVPTAVGTGVMGIRPKTPFLTFALLLALMTVGLIGRSRLVAYQIVTLFVMLCLLLTVGIQSAAASPYGLTGNRALIIGADRSFNVAFQVATSTPTDTPTATPVTPTATPTDTPTATPVTPTATPTDTPTATPVTPTATPTDTPTATPVTPTATPTDTPTATPVTPTATPTLDPSNVQLQHLETADSADSWTIIALFGLLLLTAAAIRLAIREKRTRLLGGAILLFASTSLIRSMSATQSVVVSADSLAVTSATSELGTPTFVAEGMSGQPTFVFPTATRTPTPVNLGNFVWDDLDQDGRQDGGEPGIGNVTVQLWNANKTQLIDQAVTNASGNYTLVAPQPMSVRVRVLLPSAGDTFSPKDQAGGDNSLDSDINPSGTDAGFTDVIVIAANVISMTNIDAGIILFRTPTPTRTPTPVNIGNFVWSDINGDGIQDSFEPGIEGVTVQLWNANKTALLAQAVTDYAGRYTVIAPQPMSVRVRFLLPMGATFTLKDATSDSLDSDANPSGINAGFTDIINIASNVISMTNIDAGMILPNDAPIDIGDRVWSDVDGDGVQENGEPGVSGVTVQLRNATGNVVLGSTVTNLAGLYTLTAPGTGHYLIYVQLPNANLYYTLKDSPQATEATDSDVNPTGNMTGFTERFFLSPQGQTYTLFDAGLSDTAPLSIGLRDAVRADRAGFGFVWIALALLVLIWLVWRSDRENSYYAPHGRYRVVTKLSRRNL